MITGSMHEAEILANAKHIKEDNLRKTDPVDLLDSKSRERLQQISYELTSMESRIRELKAEKEHILASTNSKRR